MPATTNILLFMIAALTLNITPGLDMMYVIARSTNQGRAAGIASAFGITGGSLLQTLAVAFGLSGLLLAVPLAYDVVKFGGALYLIYLGIRTLLSRQHTITEAKVEQASQWKIFTQGVFTNVLNPKVAIFYLAFLPQFVDTKQGHIWLQILFLGLLFNISATIVNSVVALMASSLSTWLKSRAKAQKVLQWLTGGIFIGLGVRLAFLQRQ
jgi:threonine/homoserine/homoserine lactone efflux protein